MTKSPKSAPVMIDLEEAPQPSPAQAPPVPDGPPLGASTGGSAMQTAAALAARPPSRLTRWFWMLLTALISLGVTVTAWNFVTGLVAANPLLGYLASVIIGLLLLCLILIALRELMGFLRLGKIDRLRASAETALTNEDLGAARLTLKALGRLYANREDTKWGRDRVADLQNETFDADALIGLAEREILAPLDAAALQEIEAAARQVATVTALVPLAFADVFTALTSNVRMIRRVAEVYGGRSGTLGAWRLTRAVLAHLVATGAVAVGDDLIGSVAGGSVLSKISRRFGEGVINGALTARVGLAAMDVCRPLPFRSVPRPSVTTVIKRALTGLFDGAG